MAVTIKDVAALAGVSTSTVSRVCNDNPSISKETRDRVRKAMAELGYEVSSPAAPTTSKSLKMIGIILPASLSKTFENTFYLKSIRGISQFCNARQYASTIITGRDDQEILKAVQDLAANDQVEGFIMLYSKKDDPIVDFLLENGILYVVIGKPHQFSNQTICIDNDNLLAGREATDYLYDLGHRRIAYVGPDNGPMFSADRKSGYQLSLLQHQLPLDPEFCIEIDYQSSERPEQLCSLLQREDRPTAIVVSDDILALTIERTCSQIDLSIPKDISILSFNNSLFAKLTSPQLTSVDINSFQLGFEAASQIINHAENANLMASKIIVPHSIVERDSCKRLDI